jgi:EcsC protein family
MLQAAMPIDEDDMDALRVAVKLLERTSFASRLTNLVGKPVGFVGRALPAGASQAVAAATTKSLKAAVKIALLTIRNEPQASSHLLHRTLAVASGAAGGAFGIFSLPLELPVSTIIILRSILDIARSEGENLTDPASSLACLEVLGLGSRVETADAANGNYFIMRGTLAKSVTEAARYIAERGVVEESAPVLVRLITQIASRFGVVVTQKAAAQAIPVIGALGGAAVNYAFIDHFQSTARGHFTVRRLERKYGKDVVFDAYEQVRRTTNS